MHNRQEKNPSAGVTSTSTKIISALLSGTIEHVLFHPLGSAAVRFQNHKGNVISPYELRASFANISNILKSGGTLYSGFMAGALDKVVKRGYKFAGYAFLRENILEHYFSQTMEHALGVTHKKAGLDFISGSMIGMGEVLFLPIDKWKTVMQNNKDALKNQNLFRAIFSKEGYAGWQTTISRNFLGSGLLFGVSGASDSYIFKLKNQDATMMQNFTSSALGAVFSVVGTIPWDVVKTRVQIESAIPGAAKKTGIGMTKKMLEQEGVRSLFKAGGIKSVVSVAKLCLSLTIFKQISVYIEGNKKDECPAVSAVQPK